MATVRKHIISWSIKTNNSESNWSRMPLKIKIYCSKHLCEINKWDEIKIDATDTRSTVPRSMRWPEMFVDRTCICSGTKATLCRNWISVARCGFRLQRTACFTLSSANVVHSPCFHTANSNFQFDRLTLFGFPFFFLCLVAAKTSPPTERGRTERVKNSVTSGAATPLHRNIHNWKLLSNFRSEFCQLQWICISLNLW